MVRSRQAADARTTRPGQFFRGRIHGPIGRRMALSCHTHLLDPSPDQIEPDEGVPGFFRGRIRGPSRAGHGRGAPPPERPLVVGAAVSPGAGLARLFRSVVRSVSGSFVQRFVRSAVVAAGTHPSGGDPADQPDCASRTVPAGLCQPDWCRRAVRSNPMGPSAHLRAAGTGCVQPVGEPNQPGTGPPDRPDHPPGPLARNGHDPVPGPLVEPLGVVMGDIANGRPHRSSISVVSREFLRRERAGRPAPPTVSGLPAQVSSLTPLGVVDDPQPDRPSHSMVAEKCVSVVSAALQLDAFSIHRLNVAEPIAYSPPTARCQTAPRAHHVRQRPPSLPATAARSKTLSGRDGLP
jgi:hypothetical protein